LLNVDVDVDDLDALDNTKFWFIGPGPVYNFPDVIRSTRCGL